MKRAAGTRARQRLSESNNERETTTMKKEQGIRDKGQGTRRRRDAALRGVMVAHWVSIRAGEHQGESGIVLAHQDGIVAIELRNYQGAQGRVIVREDQVSFRLMHAQDENGRIFDRWLRLRQMRQWPVVVLGKGEPKPSEAVLRTAERRAERLGVLRGWLKRRSHEEMARICPSMARFCTSVVPYAGGDHE